MPQMHFNLYVQLQVVELDNNDNETSSDLDWNLSIAYGEKMEILRAIAKLPQSDVLLQDLKDAYSVMQQAEENFNDAIAD